MTNLMDDILEIGQEPEWKTELISHLSEKDIQFIRSINIENINVDDLEQYIKLLAGCCVRNHLIDDEHAVSYVISIFYELSNYIHPVLDSIYDYQEIDAIKKYARLIHNIDNLIIQRETLVKIQEFKIKQQYREQNREPGEEG